MDDAAHPMETLTPTTIADVQAALAEASTSGTRITPVGGGTRRRPVAETAGRLISTAGLTQILQHVPAELTATVQAGVPVTTLARVLGDAGQWWPQADHRTGSTVGGVVASAASSRHRLRYGPVRDSLLEVVLVTGDGRRVKGGGPTVKSVAGYDIPRIAAGSLGALGIIVQVTVKLTPLPPFGEWFHLPAPLDECLRRGREILRTTFRVEAVLVTPRGLWVRLAGPSADVVAPPGMHVAAAPVEPHDVTMVHVGVPPAAVADLTRALAPLDVDFIAEMGTGVCDVALPDTGHVERIAGLATGLGGHATRTTDLGVPVVHAEPATPVLGVIANRLRRVFDPHAVLHSTEHREHAT